VPSAEIALLSPVTGFSLRARTQSDGMFFLNDVAAGSYSLRVSAAGFQPYVADVVLQGAAVCELKIRLDVAGQHTSITIESSPDHILETDASAVNRVERKVIEALPAASPDSGLNDAITFTTAGVAADSNGFFHPLGDHAQVSYVIDGQPVSDQRNKVFSTSIPANAIQSMEVISGSPQAEYGDKTSLVIVATTRSGQDITTPTGSIRSSYGSFGSSTASFDLSYGQRNWGNFFEVDGLNTGRFLDPPEFVVFHSKGNPGTGSDAVSKMGPPKKR